MGTWNGTIRLEDLSGQVGFNLVHYTVGSQKTQQFEIHYTRSGTRINNSLNYRPGCTFVTAASFLNITAITGITNLSEISYY